jgi:hypothetical protein
MTSLEWSVLAFFCGLLLTFGKFILDLYTRVNLLESASVENAKKDEEVETSSKSELTSVRSACVETNRLLSKDLHAKMKEIKEDKLRTKAILFKRIKEVEDKSDSNDKEINKRADEIGQGLAKVEATLEIMRGK